MGPVDKKSIFCPICRTPKKKYAWEKLKGVDKISGPESFSQNFYLWGMGLFFSGLKGLTYVKGSSKEYLLVYIFELLGKSKRPPVKGSRRKG